jgi:hypothetical protein
MRVILVNGKQKANLSDRQGTPPTLTRCGHVSGKKWPALANLGVVTGPGCPYLVREFSSLAPSKPITVSLKMFDWNKAVPGLVLVTLIAVGITVTLALNAREKGTSPAVKEHACTELAGQTNWPVHVRQPEGPAGVFIGKTNAAGQAVTVSCSTCHATTTPNPEIRRGDQLQSFHQGLHYQHGDLSCLSCHNPGNYDVLRLADGQSLAFRDSRQLCSQCHGTQARDFENGAHGGMTGYWDIARGPRHRNTCIDCHDPHTPKYQPMMPVFPPIEFLLEQENKNKPSKRSR